MKLIIDIDEEILNRLSEAELGSNVIEDVLEAVENGIPLDDVLDKIRVKILRYRDTIDRAIAEDSSKIEGMKEAYNDCLEVIDKYKVESEG